MNWTVSKVLEATGGRLLRGNLDSDVNAICTDTRQIQPRDCFVALPGERHDGHSFIPAALEKGARAFIVSSRRSDAILPSMDDASVVEVPDTLYALGELARYWRGQFAIPVVGIGGSNGKTSTKEIVAGILGHSRKILKNHGNFNNLIGVPLTLLGIQPHHEAAVVEMGINVPGEMERLAEIVRPTVGILTNIHPAHLEGLQSLDRILTEKGKLWDSLTGEDLAVVNMDDERLARFSTGLKARTITYSLKDPSAQVRVVGEVESDGGASVFRLCFGNETVPVRFPVLGMHQVQNAVAGAAAAWGMGESPETIALCLSRHQPVSQRMQVHRLKDGGMLIDDTYNANPRSMVAAVQAASAAVGTRPLVAVLGEMRELGERSAALHREVGERLAGLKLTHLVTLGELGKDIAVGACEAGLDLDACHHAGSHEEAAAWVLAHLPTNALVVVKGSRGMTMERIVEGILAKCGDNAC